MGRLYLGICEDTSRGGKWLQTVVTPDGVYNSVSGSIWRGLKARLRKGVVAYEQCINDFDSFDSFCEWHMAQDGYGLGWHLDKDLLSDSLSYSPNTCCLLPPDLNVLLQGIGSWRKGELVGCSYYKRDGNWRAYGNDFYKQVHLGYYSTQMEAHIMWRLDKAERIEAYDASQLSPRIRGALDKLVDELRQFK